ncbi:hypothetical protein C1645_819674 [Glomus cerebriforme]|uniref:Uncharacterized protein n=1 Tax=Glomus cerebriforme TaxID=658196 RepID=A0A397TAG4_9GLOM|nr:hypothetical protein C1645_819674 [Glomus cerebriforme]
MDTSFNDSVIKKNKKKMKKTKQRSIETAENIKEHSNISILTDMLIDLTELLPKVADSTTINNFTHLTENFPITTIDQLPTTMFIRSPLMHKFCIKSKEHSSNRSQYALSPPFDYTYDGFFVVDDIKQDSSINNQKL